MVDTEDKLLEFLSDVRKAPWVSLDTEADSLHAYPEKVCLIQISTPAGDRLVDPLVPLKLEPLLRELKKHRLIMHGADYDLRLFRKHHDFVPTEIFDTMLAARLLGLRQFSLSHLVETYVGVKLEKGAQKANWAMRPLTERMERYARNDTRHLKPLADRLKAELETHGRLDWHRQCCASLVTDSAEARADQDEAWRLKGSQALDRRGLAVLRDVWQWREREAIAFNRPPFFILSHETLVAAAEAACAGRPVESILPRHLSERRRTGLIKAVQHAMQLSIEQLPKPLRRVCRRPSEGEKRRYHELQKRRDARAATLGIDPTIIASRAVISELAHNWDKHVVDLMPWQRELLEK